MAMKRVAVRRVNVFVSYARADAEAHPNRIGKLWNHLKDVRDCADVWWDKDISPGEIWTNEIERCLSLADIALFITSDAFVNSEWCAKELRHVDQRRVRGDPVRVIPVLLSPIALPKPLKNHQGIPSNGKWIRHFRPQENGYYVAAQQILAVVQEIQQTLGG